LEYIDVSLNKSGIFPQDFYNSRQVVQKPIPYFFFFVKTEFLQRINIRVSYIVEDDELSGELIIVEKVREILKRFSADLCKSFLNFISIALHELEK
jgi:hypothetical protein